MSKMFVSLLKKCRTMEKNLIGDIRRRVSIDLSLRTAEQEEFWEGK